MTNTAQVCEAIRSRRELVFEYHGKVRLVWPAMHGWHVETGNELLSAYQVGGVASGELPGWKLFNVDQMREIRIEDQAGELPDSYNPNDRTLRQHCRA